ncbi:protein FAR1-RELATED SEQUENCE 5-like isoform X4 [Trifolium pratense]|uniref:protein FAR1-RELATED SEQUENCE 5-like isoform X4 n=2 Tax=Trifolium pratense TaxID=57577 RepID=UPI001E696AD5|nr:protein FAR1-RELATED SEQUENCE 5-like isoform X4 [Trifolium pratense]
MQTTNSSGLPNCEANMDNGRDADDVEMNSGNDMHDEEGEDDLDGYTPIDKFTDDDIREMEFESEQNVVDFYEMYAEYHGFAVRKDFKESDMEGNIVKRQLVCNRRGQRHKSHLLRVNRRREPRPITRTDCRARIHVAYNVETKRWRVVTFESVHNHELIPRRFVHCIPKYRRLSEADKALADGLHTCGVRTCHILGFMMAQKGGHEGLGFIKKDLYNYFSNGAKARRENGDAIAALCYFQSKADNEPMFYSKFTIDNGRLQNLFWSDGTSRFDFECFGDVLAFDTTYKRNRYNKPFVIFSGLNHHGETTIFGCALISDETTETYKWLLNTLSDAMFKKHPRVVVTDGDGAMREAIRVEFPNAFHRLCSWHLHQNAIQNVKSPKFVEEFNSLMYADYFPEKFETEWKRITDDCDVSNHKWVKKVYETKTMWASAYMRDKFVCGIRTTSRCEGINSFIKGYVEKKNSLVEFIHNFERAVKEYRHNELLSDFNSLYYEPVLTNALEGIEIDASKVFTRNKFREVKKQIEGAGALNVIERTELGNNVTLKMNRFCNPNLNISVRLDKVENIFSCDCSLFEREGIPCSHIICAMRHEHINVFPKSLICKRWTKSAKNDYISSTTSFEECDSEKLFMFRRGAMSAAFNTLCEVSCKHDGSYKEAIEGLHNLLEKIRRHQDGNNKNNANPSVIGDPENVKSKGAPRRNKKSRGNRYCTRCKRPNHNKQTCPLRDAPGDLHQVEGEGSAGQPNDESMDFNAAHNNRGSKQKRKRATVANSKQAEKEKSNKPKENMSDTNEQDIPGASAFVNPNHSFNIDSNVMRHGFVFGNPTSKMERQKATWNYGVGYGADYFTTCNGVRNQSASIFPQFVPNQSAPIFPQFHPNQSSPIFPQFHPNQSSPIFPQFPPVDNNFLRQSRTHDFPRYTRVSIN